MLLRRQRSKLPAAWRRSRTGGLLALLVSLLLGLLALALIGALGWVGYAEHARIERETLTPEQIAADPARTGGRWVPVADAELYVQHWGDARQPTLLLTHGTGAWSGTWFGLPAALASAGWHVVAVDLPPFGLSKPLGPASRMAYTRQAQARRILALIDTLGPGPVTLVGHSFGAGPALEAALLAGGRLRQLVLVDPALGLGNDGSAPRCEAGTATPGQWLQPRGLRTALVGATATWPGLTTTLLKQFVHRQEVVTDALASAYQVPFTRRDFSAGLGDWVVAFAGSACEPAASLSPAALQAWARGPTRVSLVWGGQDRITPLAQARTLQVWMPKATLTVLPGVGHIPHIEAPDDFAGALIGVLRR